MLKKIALAVLLCLSVIASSMSVALDSVSAGTIKERIQSNQGSSGGLSTLESNVDQSTSRFVDSARRIFITLTIIFGLILALAYLKAGFSPETLRETKGRILFFIAFLALAFWTEQILGFVFNIFGIDLTSL